MRRLLCLLALPLVALPALAQASHGLPLVNMSQQQVPSGTTIASGGTLTGTQIGFQVSSDSPTCGDDYRVEFEVVQVSGSFSGSPTFQSPIYPNFKTSCAVIAYPRQDYTIPAAGTSWMWRVREVTYIGGNVSNIGSWTDFGGSSDTDFISNLAPIPVANGPYSGNQGTAIALTATGSSDPDGTIALYEWDCTDNGSYETSSSSATGSTCTYSDDGSFTARLRVTDNRGATATATAAVTVTNTAPTAVIAGAPYAGTRNSPVSVSGVGSSDPDGTISQYAWDCANDGVFEVTSASATGSTCTYTTVGSRTLALRVTDDDGATATATATVVISIVPPVAEAGGPYSGNKGFAIAVSGSASSDADGSLTAYAWDCGNDGTYEISGASPSASCTFPTVGTKTIVLRVTDDDGATATDTASVAVANSGPTAQAGGPYAGNEGATIALNGSGSTDAGGAITQYAWDCTDDSSYETFSVSATGSSCTYSDNGVYTVRLRVTDDDAATATATATVTISNVAPGVTVTIPATGSEGTAIAVSATGSDPSSVDQAALTYAWTALDGGGATVGTASGSSASFTFADNGNYTISVVVTDPQGATATGSGGVAVGNVAPVITSTAGGEAVEAVEYSYQPTVTEPGDDVLTFSLSASAPAGMTLDPATGLLTGTPTYAQALVGLASFVITVSDGDGGTDLESVTVSVSWADVDGDDLADTWEDDNGLDPSDPSDAAGDPDADGLSNLDEFEGGSDPNVYDGPGAPTPVAPIGGAEAASVSPDLLVDNALDPSGDLLLYTFEVYADAAMATLVTSAAGVAEGTGQTEWKVDVVLTENVPYYWRARASDPFVDGPFSGLATFVVNAQDEAPSVPTLVDPIGGETAASLTPELVWTEAQDVDGDTLTYDIEVLDEAGGLVVSVLGVAGDGLEGRWTVDVTLSEDTLYAWTARAVDGDGVAGAWAAEEWFFVDTDNGAPIGTAFVDPDDGAVLAALPILKATESEDPEGGVLEYHFMVDSLATFDGADLEELTVSESGTGFVEWDLSDLALPENSWLYARVEAVDEGGISSTPDTISFYFRGENDAPSVPVLALPEDGSSGEAFRLLVVRDPTDPEGDLVSIEFVVGGAVDMAVVLEGSDPVLTGLAGGTTSWLVTVPLEGTVYWTARAVDEFGAVSDWAVPFRYEAPREDVPDDEPPPEDCACATSIADGSAGWASALLLLPLLRRRRRAS